LWPSGQNPTREKSIKLAERLFSEADLVGSYTGAQAVKDGFLVDVRKLCKVIRAISGLLVRSVTWRRTSPSFKIQLLIGFRGIGLGRC
jgi:hypothetical protein